MSGNETPMRGHIQINNVSKIYDPDGAKVLAVDRCTMDIAPGEFCVVVGPSGCGKTTLLNAIAGFHSISSGEILLDGEVLCSADKQAQPGSDRIVVFQNGALFPWFTVLENVTFGPIVQKVMGKEEAEGKAMEMLGQMGLMGIENNYPSEISSGMRRRVEIARAMMNTPRVLLLDEPFRAMDALTKTVVHQFLLQVYDRRGHLPREQGLHHAHPPRDYQKDPRRGHPPPPRLPRAVLADLHAAEGRMHLRRP